MSESQTSFLRQTVPKTAAHVSTVGVSSGLTICLLLLLGLMVHSCTRTEHARVKLSSPVWAGLSVSEPLPTMTPEEQMLIWLPATQ